ncbi:MAG: hypothetical protein H6733_13995 [Alphaproteobacteria bacterium]|nr:hypothetical protein [Alphaproteobacteria bacterium]
MAGHGRLRGAGASHGRPFGFGLAASRPSWTSLGTLLRLSVPSAIQQQLFATGLVVLFWILGGIGAEQVAAANVLINVTLVAILPGIGLGLAAASLVGQALGRGDGPTRSAGAGRWWRSAPWR